MTPREWALDAAYGVGWRLVRGVPEAVVRAAFERAADLAARRGGTGGWAQLRRNLARVRPSASPDELDDLVRAALRSYARYWCEAFRLPSMDHDALRAAVGPRIEGLEHVEAALAAGRGMIIALPHSGNWDVAGVWLVGRCGSFTTVAERLRPESLYRRFVAYRESLGFEILPLTGGGEPAGEALARRLRRGGAVCLVADRDLGAGGVRVSFFGEPAKLPVGPARLAERTGAALLPIGLWFTDCGWGFRVHPPVAAPSALAATQAVADAFAADIAEHPADWHMLQPLWLADRPARRPPIAEGVT
jgi:phosphatidylinositol dimannoside acyltransferase